MIKVVAGVLGAGAVATGGALVYKGLLKSTTSSIKDLLATKNPEKRLISKSLGGSSSEWKEAWKLYLTAYKNNNQNPFSLTTDKPSTDPDGNQEAPSEFIDKCTFLASERVADEKDSRYQNVFKYCTRATLVKDLIFENYPNRKILSSTGSDDSEGWKSAWSRYKQRNPSTKVQGNDEWKLSEWTTHNTDDAPNGLKTKCVEKVKLEMFDTNNKDYKDTVDWCTN
ncbi:hypothetical protein MHC_01150 [Mycoplasma haemocanis str. Illinois]|uniref:Uncharacterized protein n=1 Tax=Mycoplasma haemocanis (strain Illinois) TaxID=1111676 RepID=H6N624_MYCHN|nr:hypothetical protein [Mycoplasma haemocanis]AEW45096.1 hypothetical protein MHC_01150 [Mycoplasma haemocanis str. Illinois]